MVGLADNPEYWRARAEETRTLADSLNDKESKQIMLGIAKDYELAERAEERLKRGKKSNVIEALDDRPSATPVLFGLTPHGRSVRVLALDAVRSISLGQVSGDADGVR